MPRINYKNKSGQRLQGATTIKSQNVGWGKSPLMYWANKQGLDGKTLQESYNTATIPGTIAHYFVECHLKQVEPVMSLEWSNEDIEKAQTAFKNFLTWTEQFKFKPLLIEPHLVSEYHQYGGTPDVIGEALGRLCIIDWKTGKIYEDIFLQLAAYQVLAEENNCGAIQGFHVLRIPKNEDIPSFHHSYWETLPDEAWQAFECALNLAKHEKILKQLL